MRAESSRLRVALLIAALLVAGRPASAAVSEATDQVDASIDTVRDAVVERIEGVPVVGDVSRRLHLSASWTGAWVDAERDSQVVFDHFDTWDARFFADLDLAEELRAGGVTLANAVGVSAEWNLYRIGMRFDEVGELYLDLQGLGGSSWVNVQVGRFQLPVGEGYLRFGKAWRDNPFLSNPVAGTWWWDEGVRIHGRDAEGRFGYVASYTSGETPREWDVDGDGQLTLKLWTEPRPWLHLSVSGMWAAATGNTEVPANTALWMGETWATGFGSLSRVPNLQDGQVVPDGPNRLHGLLFLGGDAVLTHPAGVRLWLSYGHLDVDADRSISYDRSLHSWVAEIVAEGRLLHPALRPLWLALRASGLGTYDRDAGYRLDFRYASTLGYDVSSLEAYSLGVGWHLGRHVDLKLEYTRQDLDLARGAAALGLRASRADYFGTAIGVHF